MSRSKPDKVFVIRDAFGRALVHILARHGKGALSVARQHGVVLPHGSIAFEAEQSKASLAINAAKQD